MTKRDIHARYKGSVLSWSWSMITPVLMLSVYTFVFSEVFQARWGKAQDASPLTFAINLFVGLIVFNIFSETVTQSPTCIVNHSNLVSKVVFPVEILPVLTLCSALFNGLMGFAILLTFQGFNGLMGGDSYGLQLSAFYIPAVILPLVMGCLALSWALAGLGVYLRDLSQAITVATSLLLFLSAVFYPLDALPAQWLPYLQLNPLVGVIEQCRRILVQGIPPDANYLVYGSIISFAACEITYRLFRKARRGFADVL